MVDFANEGDAGSSPVASPGNGNPSRMTRRELFLSKGLLEPPPIDKSRINYDPRQPRPQPQPIPIAEAGRRGAPMPPRAPQAPMGARVNAGQALIARLQRHEEQIADLEARVAELQATLLAFLGGDEQQPGGAGTPEAPPSFETPPLVPLQPRTAAVASTVRPPQSPAPTDGRDYGTSDTWSSNPVVQSQA